MHKQLLMVMVLVSCVDSVPSDDPEETRPELPAERGTLRVRDLRGEIIEIPVTREGERAIFDGDQDVGAWSRTRERGSAVANLSKRWANNTVRYKFDSLEAAGCNGASSCVCDTLVRTEEDNNAISCEALSTSEKAEIRAALDEYTRLTGIVFEESNTIPYIAL